MAIDPDRIAELVATVGDVAATLLRIAVDGMDQLERDTELDRLQRRAAGVLKSSKWLADDNGQPDNQAKNLCKSCGCELYNHGKNKTLLTNMLSGECNECRDARRKKQDEEQAAVLNEMRNAVIVLLTRMNGFMTCRQIIVDLGPHIKAKHDRAFNGSSYGNRIHGILTELSGKKILEKAKPTRDGAKLEYRIAPQG